MSRAITAGSYRAVFRLPHALRLLVPALVGRLAYGLFPLATLFTVQQATGSYAVAGLAIAAFGLTTVLLPVKARLADRLGARRVLPPLAVVSALALAAASFSASVTAARIPLVALITVAGLAAPPLGPVMRSAWRTLTDGTGLKERAYAVDAIAEESLYLAGPLLAGLLIALGPSWWALMLTAALLLTGTLAMAVSCPAAAPVTAAAVPAPAPPLRSRGLRSLLVVVLAAGAGTSVAYTCMAAFAAGRGHPGAAGLIEAAIGLGSVLGGLLWARRTHTQPRSRQLAFLLAVLAAGLLAAAAAPGLISLGAALSLMGLAVAPLFVVAYLTADDLTDPASRTEAGTWVNVAANGGNAAGAALAGLAVDAFGTARGFLAGAAILTVAALLAGRLSHGTDS